MSPPLDEDVEVVELQRVMRLPSGDLPGLWRVRREDLEACDLPVRPVPEPAWPERLRGLHWETVGCPDDRQARVLALAATRNGILVAFRKAR